MVNLVGAELLLILLIIGSFERVFVIGGREFPSSPPLHFVVSSRNERSTVHARSNSAGGLEEEERAVPAGTNPLHNR
uniref:Secreted protein n=1 Tax=Kalanchoe fedtschenkoi TaxID=63787 RepID=A0A7N0ZQL0_KALFE